MNIFKVWAHYGSPPRYNLGALTWSCDCNGDWAPFWFDLWNYLPISIDWILRTIGGLTRSCWRRRPGLKCILASDRNETEMILIHPNYQSSAQEATAVLISCLSVMSSLHDIHTSTIFLIIEYMQFTIIILSPEICSSNKIRIGMFSVRHQVKWKEVAILTVIILLRLADPAYIDLDLQLLTTFDSYIA